MTNVPKICPQTSAVPARGVEVLDDTSAGFLFGCDEFVTIGDLFFLLFKNKSSTLISYPNSD